jgi:hypothetical protein
MIVLASGPIFEQHSGRRVIISRANLNNRVWLRKSITITITEPPQMPSGWHVARRDEKWSLYTVLTRGLTQTDSFLRVLWIFSEHCAFWAWYIHWEIYLQWRICEGKSNPENMLHLTSLNCLNFSRPFKSTGHSPSSRRHIFNASFRICILLQGLEGDQSISHGVDLGPRHTNWLACIQGRYMNPGLQLEFVSMPPKAGASWQTYHCVTFSCKISIGEEARR